MVDSCKIYRIGDEIKLEKNNEVSSSNDLKLNDYEDSLKMGEIEYKKNHFYFIPNKKDNMNDLTGEELFTWLIFKGTKFPLTKHKYRIKEGDILKLGRIWLIVRGIHIPQNKNERRNTNCLISYHSQIKESLNINNDFKEDKQIDQLIDNNSNISENQEEEEEGEEEDKEKENNDKKNKTKISPFKNKNKNNNYKKIHTKFDKKFKEPIIIDIKRNLKNKSLVSNKKEKKRLCRICYMGETNSIIDPLIKPCKCSGSMKYIHLKCLLHWLKTKIQVDKSEYIENDFFTLYSSEKVECELCKQIFPHYIRHKNRLYNLLELENTNDKEKEEKKKKNNVNYTDGDNIKKNKERKDYQNKDNNDTENYIIFDTIAVDKTVPSYIYVAKFNKEKKLKIGRGLDMNLIMNDLSISRSHCQLELSENGDVLLQDNNSKFGTLVLVQANQIEILKGQTLTIQVGRTFFNIKYKKDNSSLFNCCNADVIEKKKTYEDINYRAVKLNRNAHILTESVTEGSDNEEENKNSENDYENAIKKINNKKVNILKIVKNKKELDSDNTNISKENKLKNIKTLDNISKNQEDLYLNGEQKQEINNIINKDEEIKKDEINK